MIIITDVAYFDFFFKAVLPSHSARNTGGLNLCLLNILLSYQLLAYMILDTLPVFSYVYFVFTNSIEADNAKEKQPSFSFALPTAKSNLTDTKHKSPTYSFWEIPENSSQAFTPPSTCHGIWNFYY